MALLAALGHVSNLGQLVEIGQGHSHQREQIRWTKRGFAADSQALKVSLLGAARDDIRGTYDSYVERLDSLLLLTGILFTTALSLIQFSNNFMPGLTCLDRKDAEDCIEVRFPWLLTVWTYLIAIDLFLPLYSLCALLYCKRKLETWLQHTLYRLQQMRKDIVITDIRDTTAAQEEEMAEDQKRIVAEMGDFIVRSQDSFLAGWNADCALHASATHWLLFFSVFISEILVAFMVWVYLADRVSSESYDHIHFAVISIVGFALPSSFFIIDGFAKKNRRAFSCSSVPISHWISGISMQPAPTG
jgi:hypothetical protein